MFRKLFNSKVMVGVVLIGFCIYILQLSFTENINLYIHPRYNLFSVSMSAIAVVLLVSGVVLHLKKKSKKHHEHAHEHKKITKRTGSFVLNGVVVIVLALAFILPAQALSTQSLEQRTVKTALVSDEALDVSCPTEEAETIDRWVYQITSYPIHCNEGKEISLSGFVYESPMAPLPGSYFYLGRVVMSCCTIDAVPYTLAIEKNGGTYPKDSWWSLTGTLVKTTINNKDQLVIKPTAIEAIEKPDNPYHFINTPVAQPVIVDSL